MNIGRDPGSKFRPGVHHESVKNIASLAKAHMHVQGGALATKSLGGSRMQKEFYNMKTAMGMESLYTHEKPKQAFLDVASGESSTQSKPGLTAGLPA